MIQGSGKREGLAWEQHEWLCMTASGPRWLCLSLAALVCAHIPACNVGHLVATPPGSTAQVAPVDLGLRLGPVPSEQGHEPACMWCDCRRV